MEVVGYVDDLDDVDEESAEGRPPLLGRLGDLEEVIDKARARSVIVAFGPSASQELVTILRSAVLHDTEVYVGPRFFELGLTPAGPDVELVWGIPLARVRRAALRVTAFRLKRAVDMVLAALLLVLFSPVLLVSPVLLATAAAVKLSSHGPVLFRQARVGQFGRPIEVLKFRTLSENDDADAQWTVAADPRQTRTGTAFLSASPAWPRSTTCGATPRSRSGPGSTTTTSSTGPRGRTSRSPPSRC
jgi:hypothetical protein